MQKSFLRMKEKTEATTTVINIQLGEWYGYYLVGN